MSSTENVKIFTKARVSNITAAVVILAVVWGFVAGVPDTVAEGSFMGILVGFASKHLFDSSQK
jgi:hypothetical protein